MKDKEGKKPSKFFISGQLSGHEDAISVLLLDHISLKNRC
jgi:hypothetical protein